MKKFLFLIFFLASSSLLSFSQQVVNTTSGFGLTAQPTYVSSFCGSTSICSTDESVAIQAIVTATGCGATGNCYVVDDMCGIQTWSTQPFSNGSNSLVGKFEFKSNCPASNPHIVSVDGVSTILTPSGLIISGQGTASSARTPQYNGGAGGQLTGTYIRACNPVIYPCIHGGFTIQSGTIASITTASNYSVITMVGKPFDNNVSHFNNISEYRFVLLANVGAVGGAQPTDNGAWIVDNCAPGANTCATATQAFKVAGTLTACASSCGGTAFLDTPLMAIGSGGGVGVFGTRIENLTIDCSFMQGCGGWVNAVGQELTGLSQVNSWNATMYYGRIDESQAYAGASAGATNSGPYGPLSGNVQIISCGNTTCACQGFSSGCSSNTKGTPGTVALGTDMSCGHGTSKATISAVGGDPCTNASFGSFLFSGSATQQGIGRLVGHITSTISDKSGGAFAVPGLWGVTSSGNTWTQGGQAGMFTCGMNIIGTHMESDDFHPEFYPTAICIGGDPSRTPTYYYAYTASTSSGQAPTMGVTVNGGYLNFLGGTDGGGGVANAILVDIGGSISDAAQIGDVELQNMTYNGGGGATTTVVKDNVYNRTCFNYQTVSPNSDLTFSYKIGHISNGAAATNAGETGFNTPQLVTTCSNLPNLVGGSHGIPLIANGTIGIGNPVKWSGTAGQVAATTTTDAGTPVAGILVGVAANGAAANQSVSIVKSGLVSMTLGTGTCTVGSGQVVVIDTTTNGDVKCVAPPTYATCNTAYALGCAGSVIGTPASTQASVGSAVIVDVGLR